MVRYKLVIEYDGRAFCGWQRQPGVPTVQECLEEAFLKFTGIHCPVVGAGRTDTGVHARGQVAHVDLPKAYETYKICGAINASLHTRGGVLLTAQEVPDTFHARFSAKLREYVYIIVNRPRPLTFEKGLAWQVYKPLCVEAMREGASYLLGYHDFSAFRSSECDSMVTKRTIDRIDLCKQGDHIYLRIQSRAFLRNQVRIIMGTLKHVGEGRYSPDYVAAILESKDRTRGGVTAPPHGLYFNKVYYNDDISHSKQPGTSWPYF